MFITNLQKYRDILSVSPSKFLKKSAKFYSKCGQYMLVKLLNTNATPYRCAAKQLHNIPEQSLVQANMRL